MLRVFRTPPAEDDLASIWLYIARDNRQAAERQLTLFQEKFELLASSPFIGTACPEFELALRYFTVGNYAIFYCADEQTLTVVRILHGARDFTASFGSEP
jgi:toxin ParE1/3/4